MTPRLDICSGIEIRSMERSFEAGYTGYTLTWGLSFQIRRLVGWERYDRALHVVWNCGSRENTSLEFFEDALRKVQSRGRDIRVGYCRSGVRSMDLARANVVR